MMANERKCPSCSRTFAQDMLFCPLDGAPLVKRSLTSIAGDDSGADPYIGLRLLGQIELRRLAGVGSMARVYQAFQHGVERDVAVKILHRELSSNPEIVERFHREARVASRLSHPNVVQILLTAELPSQGPQVGGELVLVMEYLDGLSLLSALSASGGSLSLPRALHIVLQICDAVGEAHAQGVVHRDLKPENVMLVKRADDADFVKVLDFGLARLNARDASYATRSGAIFGSPRYISPEGAQGQPAGAPADVYAIATLLYQCLAGRTPFEADTAVGFLLAHANESPARLSTHARSSYVPEPIVDVIDQALSKKPEDRHPDAHALGKALIEAARKSGLLTEALIGLPGWLSGKGGAAGALASLARTHQMPLQPLQRAELGTPLSTGTMMGDDEQPGERAPAEPPYATPLITGAPAEAATAWTAEASPYAPPVTTSNVAATLFDAPLPFVPPIAAAPGPSAPPAQPSPPQAPQPTPAPLAAVAQATPPPQHADTDAQTSQALAPQAQPHNEPAVAQPTMPSAPALHEPPQHAETTPPRKPWATLLLVAACFVGGGALAALGATRLGVFGSALSPADALLNDISEAASRQAWDTPPDRNVRDLLVRGHRDFPDDARFVEARRRAAMDITLLAVQERNNGRVDESARLSRVALELDDQNASARALLAELEAARQQPAQSLPSATATAPTPRVSNNAGGARGGDKSRPQPPNANTSSAKSQSTGQDAADKSPSAGNGKWLLGTARCSTSRPSLPSAQPRRPSRKSPPCPTRRSVAAPSRSTAPTAWSR